MPTYNSPWTEEEFIVSLDLYYRIPPSKRSGTNQEIIRCAELFNRTPASFVYRLGNYSAVDPLSKMKGFKNGGQIAGAMFRKYSVDKKKLKELSSEIIYRLSESEKKLKKRMDELAEDATFQQLVESSPPADEPETGAVKPPSQTQKKGTKSYKTKPGISKKQLIKANFKCEVDESHTTFISRATNKQYLEAHHLIPISKQADFPNASLDVTANILALCPLCHRRFHHAIHEPEFELIERFLKERRKVLEGRGIFISSEKLRRYYSEEDTEDMNNTPVT